MLTLEILIRKLIGLFDTWILLAHCLGVEYLEYEAECLGFEFELGTPLQDGINSNDMDYRSEKQVHE